MADLLDYYLGPTGIPARLRMLNNLFNPYAEPVEYAGYAMREDLSPEQRANYASYAISQAGIASLPGAMHARKLAGLLRNAVNPDPSDVTKGRAVIRRDNVYRGEGPARVPLEDSKLPYGIRLTGIDQLEDMIASGLVRPKPGGYGKRNSSSIYFGESSTPDPMASMFSRPSDRKPVALVGRRENLTGYEGGVPIDALESILMRQESGELLDILEDVLARNRAR